MNKNRTSMKKCPPQQGKKRIENVEEVLMTANVQVEIENGNSPQRSYDTRIGGHSTPIGRKAFNVEDSPELDNGYSPIMMPCTQDGSNEIAWDWQSSANKNPTGKHKTQNTHVETPKRTKFLQKKRNSNSPLLHKPLKRKQVKMENIENIGKLAAELKALTERMGNMKQNESSRNIMKDDKAKDEATSQLMVEIDADDNCNDDLLLQVVNESKPSMQKTVNDNNNKRGSSYEDLFDDSIDDSMVKCSQEIEEKFNLDKSKSNNVLDIYSVFKQKESSSVSEKEAQYFTTLNITGSSGTSSTSKNSLAVNVSTHLRTYSKNLSRSSSFNVQNSRLNETNLKKSNSNNNVINQQKRITHDNNEIPQRNSSELFKFPDDSFDDCLATCIEDEKLFFQSSSVFNCVLSGIPTSKQNDSNTRSSEKNSNKFSPKKLSFSYNTTSSKPENTKLDRHKLAMNDKSSNINETVESSLNASANMENRKFFKTKSLSANSVSSSVSKTSPVVQSQNPSHSNNPLSINCVANAHTFNRSTEKEEDGNCIIKYKSTSSLCNKATKIAKYSRSTQCTPEEIERKRREAKMKLEAKRKQQQSTKQSEASLRVPMKRSVKR